MQGVRAHARERWKRRKSGALKHGSRKCDSFFSKHPIKTSDVFQKTWEIFSKTWEVFQHISHVFFYTLRCTIPFTREISHRTTTYSTAGTWLCPVIPISQHTKGSATEDEWSKTMAQPQSTLKRQSWVDCRARSAGGEGTTPMLGQSYTSRQ